MNRLPIVLCGDYVCGMPDNKMVDLLQYLEQYGIGDGVDVSKVMLKYYPINNKKDGNEAAGLRKGFLDFCSFLQEDGLIDYRSDGLYSLGAAINTGDDRYYTWLDDTQFYVWLKPKGMDYLTALRNQENAPRNERKIRRLALASVVAAFLSAVGAFAPLALKEGASRNTEKISTPIQQRLKSIDSLILHQSKLLDSLSQTVYRNTNQKAIVGLESKKIDSADY